MMALFRLLVSSDLALAAPFWSYSVPMNKSKISSKPQQLHQISYVPNILFCGLFVCDAIREAWDDCEK